MPFLWCRERAIKSDKSAFHFDVKLRENCSHTLLSTAKFIRTMSLNGTYEVSKCFIAAQATENRYKKKLCLLTTRCNKTPATDAELQKGLSEWDFREFR
jgi:hypothetical protein